MKKDNKDNLELWNAVEKTDPAFTKKVQIGKRSYTAIDPAYQTKKATEQFGRYGQKWGLRDIKWGEIIIGDTIIATLEAVFFTPDGQVETGNSMKMAYKNSSGYLTIDDEYRKKLITNTISKELSRLGFNSDVFQGKFDDERYIKLLEQEKEQTVLETETNRVAEELEKINDIDSLREYFLLNKGLGEKITKLITDKGNELKKNKND